MEKPIIINRVFETTDTMLYSRSEWWFSRYIHPSIHTYIHSIPGTAVPGTRYTAPNKVGGCFGAYFGHIFI